MLNQKTINNLILSVGKANYTRALQDHHRKLLYINNELCEIAQGDDLFKHYLSKLINEKLAIDIALLNHQDGLYGFLAFPKENIITQLNQRAFNEGIDLDVLTDQYLGKNGRGKYKPYKIFIAEKSRNEIEYVAVAISPVTGEEFYRVSLDITYSDTIQFFNTKYFLGRK